MPDTVLLEKLRKIKALADDAQNDHECQTAMLMFQRLLAKNGLDVAEVDLEPQSAEAPERMDIYEGQRVEKWLHYLHCAVANHFRCVPVTRRAYCPGQNSRQTLQFIGHRRDAMIAAETFQTAVSAAEHLFSRYRLHALEEEAFSFGFGVARQKACKLNRSRYLLGFALGLEAAYRKQEAEATFDIILTTPADVLDVVKGFKSQSIRTTRCERDGNTTAGYADGFNVGRGNSLPDTVEA